MASADMQRWVSFDPVLHSLTEFLAQWKPTETFAPKIEWLCVSRLKVNSKLQKSNVEGLISAWEALCVERLNIVNCEDVQCLAVEYNVVSGKWLMYIHPKLVDEAWSTIARAVIDGLLGDDAKVSSSHVPPEKHSSKKVGKEFNDEYSTFIKLKQESEYKPSDAHVICVYANDFNDLESVFMIRENLDQLGFKAKMSFKPDAYSFCQVYSGNQWGIPPTIYCS